MVFPISLGNSKSFKTKELWKQILTGSGKDDLNNAPKTQSPYIISFWLLLYKAGISGLGISCLARKHEQRG